MADQGTGNDRVSQKMIKTDPLLIIDSAESLFDFTRKLNYPQWIALDTEFVREKTYFPNLCLIQIASQETIACIDTIAISKNDLQPLIKLMFHEKTTKILHGATQDIEILYHLCGTIPSPIFDTQIAAGLLGQGNQIGYAPLVETFLGIKIDKSQSRTDWSQRPLSNEQLTYAANDVRFLQTIYLMQAEQLMATGRREWFEEETLKLYETRRYATTPHDAWQKIKTRSSLNKEQLTTLQVLCAYREEIAIKRNLPRRWVVSDETLIDAAKTTYLSAKAPDLPARDDEQTVEQLFFSLLQTHKKTKKTTPTPFRVNRAHSNGLTINQKKSIHNLLKQVQDCSAHHNISPAQLLTRRQIEAIVKKEQSLDSIGKWQSKLLGSTFMDELRNLVAK